MKPFIGMTAKADIPITVYDAVVRFMQNPVCDAGLHVSQGEGFVGRARNNYSAIFMKEKEYTDLISIDSDIPFDRWHIERIMSHDVDVVGGVYYRKQWERVPVMEALMPDGKVHKIQEDGLLQVRYMGTGFLRVRRKVLEAMIEKYDIWFTHEETDQLQWDFWPCAIDKEQRRYLSEDWWFCHRANELGFKVWADTKCVVPHLGTAIFPLRNLHTQTRLQYL